MATKRDIPDEKPAKRKTAKRKTATSTPALTDDAVIAVLESSHSGGTVSAGGDPDDRRQRVAAEAYFLAERRGFAAGHELEDWVAAEVAVDSRARAG